MATNQQDNHSVPTGCFKCGRPGHWSRDCPVDSGKGPGVGGGPSSTVQGGAAHGAGDRLVGKVSLRGKGVKASAAEDATMKVPRRRPHLTADLLLTENGLGYLLEKMPQMVKVRGEGHEVHNLKSLLEGYVHWHSQLHPYLGFNDFVAKVEKLGATRRVRMCVRELRDKVTSGFVPDASQEVESEDVSHEAPRPPPPGRASTVDDGREFEEWLGADANEIGEIDRHADPAMPVNEDEFEDFFRQGTTQANETIVSGRSQQTVESAAMTYPVRKLPSLLDEDGSPAAPAPVTIDETLAARMEANRLKALERAKARRADLACVSVKHVRDV